VAEGGGLLNRYTVESRIEGSNPSVSAKDTDLATFFKFDVGLTSARQRAAHLPQRSMRERVEAGRSRSVRGGLSEHRYATAEHEVTIVQ
jgi:hypothetical protein